MDLTAVLADFGPSARQLPRELLYGEDAAELLPDALIREGIRGRVLVLEDRRTRELAGIGVSASLRWAGLEVEECVIPDGPSGESPVCDELTRVWVEQHGGGETAIVAIGSGVVNDLAKWVAGRRGLPYWVMATAASMNGYSAANVAPTLDGVKGLFRAKAPRAVAAIPSVLAEAPYRMTASGLGDVIAKPVSTADWAMGELLFGEPFSSQIASIIDAVEPRYSGDPEGLARREPERIAALFEALVLSGCAMTLQGSSAPASGGEHLISHTLDMTAPLDGVPHDLHGRQVGVATIFAAAVYERVLRIESPVLGFDVTGFDLTRWGRVGPAVADQHEGKRAAAAKAVSRLSEPGMWDRLRERLANYVKGPAGIKDCLRRAGAAHTLQDIGCSRERFVGAVGCCGAIRARFTSIDLGHITGVLPRATEDIIDEWLDR